MRCTLEIGRLDRLTVPPSTSVGSLSGTPSRSTRTKFGSPPRSWIVVAPPRDPEDRTRGAGNVLEQLGHRARVGGFDGLLIDDGYRRSNRIQRPGAHDNAFLNLGFLLRGL